MALVISSWYADRRADGEGNLVSISGRQQGVIAWLLTAMGIDVKTRLRITNKTVYFEQGSLSGFNQRVIPLESLSSAYFGYVKPWQEALALGIVLAPILIGFILGPLYYFLNKKLSIGVIEVSGLGSGIEFKRSVIEGQNIDEGEGRRVIGIIHDLITQQAAAQAGARQLAAG